MAWFEIPLSPQPKRFMTQLAGNAYELVFVFRDAPDTPCWVMDINDNLGNPLACGLPLVPGHDMLEQLGYLNIGGIMTVVSDGDPAAVPGFWDLGISGHLYWWEPP
jgi:hypothetical protein